MNWRRHYEELFRHEEWNVGIVPAPIHAFLDPGFEPYVEWMPRPRANHFVADPFAHPRLGGWEIICESFDYRRLKGRLVGLARSGEERALVGFPDNLHLSYPYPVAVNGDAYCVPEMWEGNEIALFRRSSDGWHHRATVVPSVPGVDSTFVEYCGRWWLFCTRQDRDPTAELWIWHADRLEGPWLPHAANPVKWDRGSARPAGTPFFHEGQLYRPAMDCNKTYGAAVVINRVLELTPQRFREEVVIRWTPRQEWRWNQGWHTLSAMGAETLIDAKRFTVMPAHFRRVVRNKLQRITGGPPPAP